MHVNSTAVTKPKRSRQ